MRKNSDQSVVRATCLRLCLCWASVVYALSLVGNLFAAAAFNSVYISEFLAENHQTLPDADGQYSGWIELYNGRSEVVNLAGWFLSDDPANLTKWRFPGVALLPGNYLVIFASGKALTNDLAHLHTNFRLDKAGGYLALIGPETNIVSEFAPGYPKQSADISYGRVRGEPATCGYFAEPTPGKPNQSEGSGFAPKVVFSRRGGSFTEPFSLSLSCASS